jgi:YgiT-type zinc finger domain-containing protein
MKRCIRCGGAVSTRKVEATREVGQHLFVASLPARVCRACGETQFEGSVLQRFDLHVAVCLIEAGVGSGAAFRFLRKALGLRAVDVAELLDVSAETLSRWETEKRALDRGALAVLAACVRDALAGRTSTLDTLRALRTPRGLEKRVQLDLTGDPADRARTA